MRKKVIPTKAKKERSPSEESLELLGTERTKGKGVEEARPQKRVKEEQSAVKGAEQKTPQKTVATPKPYYRLVTPDQWEKNKQNEGTYRLDHAAWRGEQPEFRNPFAVRGNKIRAIKDHGNLNLRIPGVVHVCRKVTAAKAPTYEIYVPVPRDPEGKKTGRILMLKSVARLKELCYTVSDLNMFLPAAEVPDEDIVKTLQNDVTARLVDFDEAV
jgi:hypothetical protein